MVGVWVETTNEYMAQVFLLRTAKLGIDPTPLPVRFAMGWLAHMCFTFHPFLLDDLYDFKNKTSDFGLNWI